MDKYTKPQQRLNCLNFILASNAFVVQDTTRRFCRGGAPNNPALLFFSEIMMKFYKFHVDFSAKKSLNYVQKPSNS